MSAARNPTNWDEYDGGGSPGESVTESMLEREQALVDDDDNNDGGNQGGFRRRRRYVFTINKHTPNQYLQLTLPDPPSPINWLPSPTLAESTASDHLPEVGSEPQDSTKLFLADRVLSLRPREKHKISSTAAVMFRGRNRSQVFCANT
jgi:hypothetical protein